MPTGWKEVVYLLLLCAAIAAAVFGLRQINTWKQGAEMAQQAGRTMGATEGITDDAGAAANQRSGVDYSVGQAADTYRRDYQEAKRHDPAISSRADRAVPDRVRDQFRARRLARERSDCTAGGCEAGSEAQDRRGE